MYPDEKYEFWVKNYQYSPTNFDDVTDVMAELTDINYHSEAMHLAALALPHELAPKFAKVFNIILNIQNLDGHLSKELSELKYEQYCELKKVAKSCLSPEQYEKWYSGT